MSHLIPFGLSINHSVLLASRDKCHYKICKILQCFSRSFTWGLVLRNHHVQGPHGPWRLSESPHKLSSPSRGAPSASNTPRSPASPLLCPAGVFCCPLPRPSLHSACVMHTATMVHVYILCHKGSHHGVSALRCVLHVARCRLQHMELPTINSS